MIQRSKKTGTQSGKCSIKPSNGLRYFKLGKSNASFHLFYQQPNKIINQYEYDDYLSWAIIVRQTCSCFLMIAKSRNVSPSVLIRNCASFERSKSTHSA